MKKIILSVAVATMALTTAAAALEDIKVNGQAKLWYETNNGGTNGMFNKDGASGEVVFKLGVTGKQGNVGFGATVYQTSTMGLEGTLVSGVRSPSQGLTGDGEMYTGEMYITAPVGAKTLLKVGKQELDTPLAFTERWNATPNTFNAAVAINNSIDNLTVVAAFVGQGNTGEVVSRYAGTSVYALGALYKNDALAVNVWGYELSSLAKAVWFDASLKAGPVALKGVAVQMMPAASGVDDTTAFALQAKMKVASVNLYAAASTVSDGNTGSMAVGNTATANKKDKLGTDGVYTDGRYVSIPGSTAFKIKASGKLAGTGLALQYINNSNDVTPAQGDMSEIDLIVSKKLGDFNMKAILMHRDGEVGASSMADGDAQQHVRVIASVNF
ncbi:MAG: imipenem/basic amino acid-specific outer membrane pore [Sulfurimonas sp.]|jgi:imipenem/basic amino acid-specific outer membrane pore|uniref:hypothetical protein n=1 Tax=Sulfurimonas sp. TaxID=2022749 RepID=UPI0039E21549